MKVGLVLEGGSMRGLYTAGVLDIMMDHNIEIDTIVGTSAGALFEPNYFSKQRGRTIRYNKRFCKDYRYISLLSFLLTGNVVNKKFAYNKVPLKLDKFDNETFMKSGKEFYCTATNIKTGEAEYFEIKDTYKQIEELRASSAVPIMTRPVEINGELYLDGGISDSIPINKCLELGCDKIIVILTQPESYEKKPLSSKKVKFINMEFKKYPNLINRMMNRHNEYNKTLKYLKELERQGKVLIIRPSEKLDIKLIERNPNKLESIYQIGINDANKKIKKIKKYLNQK